MARDTPVNDQPNGLNGSDRRFNALVIELAIRLFVIGVLIYWTFIIVLPFAAMIRLERRARRRALSDLSTWWPECWAAGRWPPPR